MAAYGLGLDGTRGMPVPFDAWQHRKGYANVGIDGDTGTAVSPFLHLHQTRDGAANLLHAGMWHDRLARLPQAGGSPTGACRTCSSTPSRA
jgi:hypothetical protein